MYRHTRIVTLTTLLLFLLPSATLWAGKDKSNLPQVKLLDRGKGKRQKLRYKLARGAKERMQVDMDMSMNLTMGGQALVDTRIPTIRMRMDMDVADVTKQGHMRFQFRYVDVKLLDTPGVEPMMKASMEQALAGLESMHGHALITDRGITIEGSFETGSQVDPQLQQLAASLEQSIQQLSAPLPVEAVGVGARWEVRTHIESNGVNLQQTARYELVELRGDRFKCKVTITQTAKAQQIQAPNLPPGAQMELVSMKGNGSGELDARLDRLTPVSNAAIASDMQMRMHAGGQAQKMGMRISMGMKVTPADR